MSGSGKAPLQTKRFEWGIERSVFGKRGLSYSLRSPNFSFVGLDNTESSWSLRFCSDSEDSFRYGLYLIPSYKTKNPSRVNIKVKVGVIMKDGTEGNVKLCQILSGVDACGFPEFIEGNLYHSDEDEDLFRNDKLTIFCDLELGRKIRLHEFAFHRMFDSGKFTDFTLVVGEEELKVHRAVLASKSSVFEAIFDQDINEEEDGCVAIKDVDAVGMKGLLQFIYFGEVKDLEEIAVKVLPAADKYGVDELKALCEKTICNKLTVKNAPSYLILADRHSADSLRTEALQFINKNAAEVAEEEKFYELAKSNPKIFKEIVKSFTVRVNKSDPVVPKEKPIMLLN